ncbi:MAG TPA: 6-bladed beta-propeller [Geobacteraceae bacterium]
MFKFVGIYSSSDVFAKHILTSSGDLALKNPYGIVSDGNGKVYVSQIRGGKIALFDFAEQQGSYFEPEVGENGSTFLSPHGLAIDAEGNIYVADTDQKRIVVFRSDRRFLRTMGNKSILERPVHVAVHEKARRVYVSDSRRHCISVFSLSGEYCFSFGHKGTGNGEFAMPYGLAVGPEGNIYVADMLNARIQVFDADGRFLRIIGNTAASRLELEFPRDVGFTSDGSLHIIDIKRAQLVTCTPEGVLRFTIGDEFPSANPLGFSSPTAMHIDKRDRVYIVDQINNRFTVWQYMAEANQAMAVVH